MHVLMIINKITCILTRFSKIHFKKVHLLTLPHLFITRTSLVNMFQREKHTSRRHTASVWEQAATDGVVDDRRREQFVKTRRRCDAATAAAPVATNYR